MAVHVCRRTPRLPGWRKARRVSSSHTRRCGTRACVVSRDMNTRKHQGQSLHYSAHPQIQIKNFQYTVTKYTSSASRPAPKTVAPKFKDMVKGGFKDGEVCMRAYLASIGQNYHLHAVCQCFLLLNGATQCRAAVATGAMQASASAVTGETRAATGSCSEPVALQQTVPSKCLPWRAEPSSMRLILPLSVSFTGTSLLAMVAARGSSLRL